MGKYVNCPFCGQRGRKTKEHVWAQWLHETAGATSLLEGTHGERIPRDHRVLRKDLQGRYQRVDEAPGPYAKWLPNVTVEVCQGCNSGWMSGLENQAKAILGPFVLDHSAVQLSTDELRALTTWATKSWMAYALTRPTQWNPFSEAEYRTMVASPEPLRRSRVWLMHAQEPRAHVGMAIESTLISSQHPPDIEATQDNTAYAYLAVATVVMIMFLVPPEAPDQLVDELVEALVPPIVSSPTVRRCWPDPRPQDFPLGVVPDADLAALIDIPSGFFHERGLHADGITDAESAAVLQEFLEGADPTERRRRRHEP